MKECVRDQYLEQTESNITSKMNNKLTKARIMKNLVMVSLTFLISFTASEGLTWLQSTMNKEVGVISLAVRSICCFIAALFLSKYFIRKFGCKLIMVVSLFAYVPYLSSNFYPVLSLMVPTSILVGFAQLLLLNSVCTYINDLASLYSKLNMENECQNDISNPLSVEKEVINSSEMAILKFYQKHRDSIFFTQPSLLGKRNSSSTNASVSTEGVALTEFMCALPPSIKSSEQDCGKRDVTKQNFREYEVDDILTHEIRAVLTLNFDPVEKNIDESAIADDKSNISFIYNNRDTKPRFLGKLIRKKIFNSQSSRLCLVPEKSPACIRKDGNESVVIVADQKEALAKNTPPLKDVIKEIEAITSRFFGLFSFILYICHILANVISHIIFQNNAVDREYTYNSSCVCGSGFCSMDTACALHNLEMPSTEIRYTLTTVYVVMSFLAALLALLVLDNLKVDNGEVSFSFEMVVMSIKFHRNKNQILLIPMSLYLGMMEAFITGDFSKDFIACAWGAEHVSLVFIVVGISACFTAGWYCLFANYIGRCVVFCAAYIVNLFVFMGLLYWIPDPNEKVIIFVITALLASVGSILWIQMKTFIGLIFKEEEVTAFGVYPLWYALGCSIVYSYNYYICTDLKIYILLGMSTISAIGYLLVERNYALVKKKCNKT